MYIFDSLNVAVSARTLTGQRMLISTATTQFHNPAASMIIQWLRVLDEFLLTIILLISTHRYCTQLATSTATSECNNVVFLVLF